MRNGCFVSLLASLFLLQQITVNGQSTYNEIPKQEIAECVLDFVNNRDCFKNYGCLMSFELQDLGIKATTTKNWDACIFEDLENRQLRSEISRTYQSISDDGTETASKIPIWSMFSIKGRKTIFEGGKEIKSFDGMAEFVVVPDPWMRRFLKST